MKSIMKICLHCNAKFQAQIKELSRGNGKFCSLKCSACYHHAHGPKPLPNVMCAFCDKLFYKKASSLNKSKSGLYFCCRQHKDAAQRIGGIKEIQPAHYNNGKYSYRAIALRHLPNKCAKCGYDKFVYVLVVHHKDHDRNNNELSNLEILCPTCHWEHHMCL